MNMMPFNKRKRMYTRDGGENIKHVILFMMPKISTLSFASSTRKELNIFFSYFHNL